MANQQGAMMASELIEKLQEHIDAAGDKPVWITAEGTIKEVSSVYISSHYPDRIIVDWEE